MPFGMKRTSPWVFVAAAAVQLAALGLCVWAMEHWGTLENERTPLPERPAPQPPREAIGVAEPGAEPPLPPSSLPAFLTDGADSLTQLARAGAGEQSVAFGFYPDGNIRFVDVDGGRYAGKAESARARMREVDGTRAFTVQIGVASDGGLQATFTGGAHDDETFPLEPLVGWSVA